MSPCFISDDSVKTYCHSVNSLMWWNVDFVPKLDTRAETISQLINLAHELNWQQF